MKLEGRLAAHICSGTYTHTITLIEKHLNNNEGHKNIQKKKQNKEITRRTNIEEHKNE